MSNPRREFCDKTYSLLSDPSLPYNDYTKGFILHHLSDLTSCSSKINPRIAKVKSGVVNLLHADVSFTYAKEKYGVTVVICFVDSYPRFCPHVRVICGDNEVLTHNNKVVAPCGEVSHSYLQNWNHNTSNLSLLVSKLATDFALESPLVVPNLENDWTLPQMKLAKILTKSGHIDLYKRLCCLDKEKQQEIFIKINSRYPRHPYLDEFITGSEEQLARFIGIVKVLLLPDADASKDVDLVSSSETTRDVVLLPPQEISQVSGVVLTLTSLANLHYEEANRRIIRQHLCDLIPLYPSLKPEAVENLIHVTGVVPYSHDGKYYHDVNVIIQLPKLYPGTRPRVFVSPSSGWCIRDDLQSVSSNGYVYWSYLRNWVESTSNLTGLVSHLSALFSCQPPLEKAPQSSSSGPPSQGVHGIVSSDDQVSAGGQKAQHGSSTTT